MKREMNILVTLENNEFSILSLKQCKFKFSDSCAYFYNKNISGNISIDDYGFLVIDNNETEYTYQLQSDELVLYAHRFVFNRVTDKHKTDECIEVLQTLSVELFGI